MSKFTRGLNQEQRKAVVTTEGPLLVLAGAGTGKTRVITHRIAHMLSNGVRASNVLAMTFTNKAAGEMKERIASLVGKKNAAELTVGTFHSFCVRSLRKFPREAGLRSGFGICDADDQLMAMKQALRDLQIPESELQPNVAVSRISLLKNKLVEPFAMQQSEDRFDATIGHAYERYNRALRASGVLDFDDLLLYMVKLLDQPDVLARFRKQYRYVFVDEYQDTNGPQYEIVRRICSEHGNVCVVGDDDQSIYGWRGADVSKILNFGSDFPQTTVVRLETNYRSTPEIIAGANSVIQNNKSRHDKALRSAADPGRPITVKRLEDEETEALFVVEDIKQRQFETQDSFGEFAILFRTAVQPRLFEMRLRSDGIPYNLVGGMSFFDRKEVRDILSFLKLIANPDDELSLLRVINTPSRGIGAASVERMLALAAEHQLSVPEVIRKGDTFSVLRPAVVSSASKFLDTIEQLRDFAVQGDLVTLVKRLIKLVGYEEEVRRCYSDPATRAKRWEAVNEILNMAEIHERTQREPSLGQFLEDITLNANDDDEEPQANRLTLMTLHSAKGLEFGEVYLVGMEEGLLPHARSIQDNDVDEERRLAYVGITRAQRRLTLSFVRSRAKRGKRVASLPSRFIYEMNGKTTPEELLQRSAKEFSHTPVVEDETKTAKKKSKKVSKRKPVKRRPAAETVKGSLQNRGLSGGEI